MKEKVFIAIIVVILVGVLISVQLLNKKTEAEVYGVAMSAASETNRTISWLAGSLLEGLSVQLKQASDGWNNAQSINAVQKASIDREEGKVYQYVVTTDQLTPASYQYRIVIKDNVISDEYSFEVSSADEAGFQFIHVTDSQGFSEADYKQWGSTLAAAIQRAPNASFIVHGGDLIEEPNVEQQWKWFFQYAEPLATIPFYPTTGNNDLFKDDATYYTTHFNNPDNGAEGSTPGTTYYVSYSGLLLISMDTEQNIKGQTEWLEELLEEQAAVHRWIVISMHRGVYGANRYKEADEWTTLFDQYGVDLVLQGHNHQYSRSFPLVDGDEVKDDEKGTVYVTLNAAGSKLNEEKKAKDYQAVAFQNGLPMYAIVDVAEGELHYYAYDVNSMLLDQFTLTK